MDSSTTTAPLVRQTYNLTEVSVLMGVSARHVYTLANEGKLPGVVKFGGRWLMPRMKLHAILGDIDPAEPVAADGG